MNKTLPARHWIDWGKKYLEENPVVKVKVFEDAITLLSR